MLWIEYQMQYYVRACVMVTRAKGRLLPGVSTGGNDIMSVRLHVYRTYYNDNIPCLIVNQNPAQQESQLRYIQRKQKTY